MVEVTKHFTTALPDSTGRFLVGDDHVTAVSYADLSGDSWKRDWSVAPTNPFINFDFSAAVVSGTGKGAAGPGWYETGADSAQPETDQYFKFFKLPYFWEEELFAAHATIIDNTSVVTGGTRESIVGDYFIDASAFTTPPQNKFPANYRAGFDIGRTHATTSGIPGGGQAFLVLDFGSGNNKEVAGFFIDSFNSDGGINGTVAANATVGEYIIEGSTTGTGDGDFSILASGVHNEVNPFWVDVTATTVRYIRLRYSNRGDAGRTNLMKFWAFSQQTVDKGFCATISKVDDHDTASAGRTFELNQDVSLAGVDYIYLNYKDYANALNNFVEVYLGGTKVIDLIAQNRVNAAADDFIQVSGHGLDTSALGSVTFQVQKFIGNSFGGNVAWFSLAKIEVVPPWHSEAASTTRGAGKAFPEQVLFVVDKKGMSIVDASNASDLNDIDLKLWMRFELSDRKMLQQRPRKVRYFDGRVYMATSRGLFILDFLQNVCVRFDERGPYPRYDIASRNVIDFDASRITAISDIPHRSLYTYARFFDSPVIPSSDVYDVVAGNSTGLGRFSALATSKGLIIFDEELDSTGVFYQSLNRQPVTNVEVVGDTIWYVQGRGSEATLNYIADVDVAAVADFVPDTTYNQTTSIVSTLSGTVDTAQWRIVNQDSNMNVVQGDTLTISGTHTIGGASGLVSKDFYASRDFEAKVSVRLREFPLDARGGVRFGFSYDYLDNGILSLNSDRGYSRREGFFVSALNIDPVGGHLVESAPFNTEDWSDYRGWYSVRTDRDAGGTSNPDYNQPRTDGVYFKSITGGGFSGDHNLNRVVSSVPMLRRNFTIRLDGKLISGFDQVADVNTYENSSAWLGIGNKSDYNPGTVGTADYINASMAVVGNSTFSGIAVYSVSRFSSVAQHTNEVLDHSLVIPLGATEGTGLETSPYREWRVDFDNTTGSLSCFVDDVVYNSITVDEFTQPPLVGTSFGLYTRDDAPPTPGREMLFKDFRINYTPLTPGSRYKYGLEYVKIVDPPGTYTGGSGGIHGNLGPFTTFSGISLATDTIPSGVVMPENTDLADGFLHIGGSVTFGTDVSVGAGLPSSSAVESLYLYDIVPSTDGWNSTTEKDVEVWYSDNNSDWSLFSTQDLNLLERTDGVTKLHLEPALVAKFIKVRGISTTGNYLVGGGAAWKVSEVEPITLSGIDFFATDASASADFHEWKIAYTASTREAKAYIDDVLISSAQVPRSIEQGQFVLLHDLSPVASGTSSFAGDFRNLSITFPNIGYIATGEIDSFSVNSNAVGNNTNFTIMTATDNGIVVFDTEKGPDAPSKTDKVQVFTHEAAVFGESTRAFSLFGDEASQRDSGLVFVGTGNVTGTPTYLQRYNKPFWLEKFVDPTKGDEVAYGGRISVLYHPGVDKVVVILARNIGAFSLLDLGSGQWSQVSRGKFLEEAGLSDNENFQTDAAKVVHSPLDDRMWMIYDNGFMVSVDVRSGDATRFTLTSDIGEGIGTDSGHYFLAYALHNHTLIYGMDFIHVHDVASNDDVSHPRNFLSAPNKWNRLQTQVPFNSGGGFVLGHAQGVYSDYDKSIYFIGTVTSSLNEDQFFYRYDIDRDYLELITDGHIESVDWPTTDADLSTVTPLFVGKTKGSWLVYEPYLKRIYVVGSRLEEPQFYYYDVVTNEWVYPGENPPYIASKDWPTLDNNKVGTSHMTYDSMRRSLVMYGRTKDPEIYEYITERDIYDKGFDYVPSRDGLPTSSGVARQFTRNGSVVKSSYTDQGDWDRDFYRAPRLAQNAATLSFQSKQLTFSGTTAGIDNTTLNKEFWVSARIFEPNSSFDIRAKVAFPEWTTHPFHQTTVNAIGPEVYFSMGIQDGLNREWAHSSFGQGDSGLFQALEIRAGVSGVENSVADVPFTGHIVLTDGENGELSPSNKPNAYILPTEDTYHNGGVALTSGTIFHDLRLSYDYENDSAEAFFDGVSAGTVDLLRKFDPGATRFNIGMYVHTDQNLTHDSTYIAQVKDIQVNPKAWDRIEDNRLITSISGSVGSYFHERWDSTLVSGTSWVCEIESFFPTHRGFSGYSYLGSLIAMGDGHKLFELVPHVGPSQQKRLGITGSLDGRYDSNNYLATTAHLWDDIELGNYRIVRDIVTDKVSLYIGTEETARLEVDYQSLPNYTHNHMFYGKVNYGDFERIYPNTTLSGSWADNGNWEGTDDPVPAKQRWKNSSNFAQFSSITATSPIPEAIYDLDAGLGEVDLYTFYIASAFDLAKDTPHTVIALGVTITWIGLMYLPK